MVGGLELGLLIWEAALLPSLIHNADTWFFISDSTIQRLENLQNTFLRNIVAVPTSAPISVLLWDSGCLSMENRVLKSKMLFLHHLVELDDESLAKQIFTKQKEKNLIGPARELREISNQLKLPNIFDQKFQISRKQWNQKVKKAIEDKEKDEVIKKLHKCSKLKGDSILDETFGKKKYLESMSLVESREMFRIRSKTTKTKMNMKSNEKFSRELWKCEDCHNKDLVIYFREVFKARDDNMKEHFNS